MHRSRLAPHRQLVSLLVCSLALGTLVIAGAATASERSVWIASGLPGGTYRAIYARNLEEQMRGYKLYYRTSSGSRENLALLAEGKADIAFAQADVFASLHAETPELAEALQVVGRLANECLFVAYRRGGRVSAFAQLGEVVDGVGVKISVGAELGGTAGSWAYLSRLDPKLATAQVDHQGGTLALNQLAVGVFDAVAWVTDPTNFEHKMLRAALANDALELMSIEDDSLLKSLPNGTQIYVSKTFPLKESWRAPKITTLCTSALVIMRRDADERLLTKVSDTISLHLDLILPRKD